MKNVKIILEFNEDIINNLMKEHKLKNFNEVRGYVLRILEESGINSQRVYKNVDVVEVGMSADKFMESVRLVGVNAELASKNLEIFSLTMQNKKLAERNEELMKRLDILQARVDEATSVLEGR